MSLKQKAFRLVELDTKNHFYSHLFDRLILILIILSTVEVVLESYQNIEARLHNLFWWFEVISCIIFSIEYLLRLWTADLKYKKLPPWKARLKFVFSFDGLVDLIAILPFYLPFFFNFDLRFIRMLRVFRLLRIFKLSRYTKSMRLVGSIFREKGSDIMVTVFITFILLLLSSTIMYQLEGDEQPEHFPNIVATFWWAIATLTTVGYGDVYPVTGWGQLVSGIIALLGIGLVALPTGIISAAFVEKLEASKNKKKKKKKAEFKYCPHCGEKLPHAE